MFCSCLPHVCCLLLLLLWREIFCLRCCFHVCLTFLRGRWGNPPSCKSLFSSFSLPLPFILDRPGSPHFCIASASAASCSYSAFFLLSLPQPASSCSHSTTLPLVASKHTLMTRAFGCSTSHFLAGSSAVRSSHSFHRVQGGILFAACTPSPLLPGWHRCSLHPPHPASTTSMAFLFLHARRGGLCTPSSANILSYPPFYTSGQPPMQSMGPGRDTPRTSTVPASCHFLLNAPKNWGIPQLLVYCATRMYLWRNMFPLSAAASLH